MSGNIFNGIDDELRKDAGCSGELDYIEQTSWILFLKYLDTLESKRETEAVLKGKSYTRILQGKYRWTSGQYPKKTVQLTTQTQ